MTTTRISRCFAECQAEGRAALVVYLTIGDPSVDDSLACARAAIDAGADLLELGVPFSDPSADGPVIAKASHRAIQRGGSLDAALEVARRLREHSDAPLILFSYYNPVLTAGEGEFPARAVSAGVDGLLLVDLPPEEGQLLRDAADRAGLAIIPLVAPTTPSRRIPLLLERASGFVYYVSMAGVTGQSEAPLESAAAAAHALSRRIALPVVVGFGVDSPAKARTVAQAGADGVVVGTALVKAIAEAADGPARLRAVTSLVSSLRSAMSR